MNSLSLDEGVFVDGLDDVFEKDFGGEGVSVMNDRLSVLTVPAVHCKTNKCLNMDCPFHNTWDEKDHRAPMHTIDKTQLSL